MDADASKRIEMLEQRVAELEAEREQPPATPRRRTVLGALAALGGAGAMATPAAGAASTTDGDGDVGEPGDRVDAFLDGADANSLDGPVVGNTTVSDLVGQGLELNANTLRVLNSVYDGTNVVADVDNTSVSTEEADVTNESFVRGTRSTETSSISSATRTNIVDGESKDNRGEFNASQEFVPDKTGEYEITGQVQIGGSTGTGDEIFLEVRVGSSSIRTANFDTTTNNRRYNFSFAPELTAGNAYTVKAYNNNSSFTINTDTYVEFIWSVVQ